MTFPRKQIRVVLLTSFLSRANGGSSTALDIAEGLNQLGFQVDVLLDHDCPWFCLLSRNRRRLTEIPLRKFRSIKLVIHKKELQRNPEFDSLRTKRSYSRSATKEIVKKIVLDTNRRFDKRKVRKLLGGADVVVNAGCQLGPEPRTILNLHPKTSLVLNHNGSVEAFESYFLREQSVKIESKRQTYMSFISKYDFLIFQSDDVASEVSQLSPRFGNRSAVIHPSCQEEEVVQAISIESPYDEEGFPVVVIGSIQRRKGQLDAVRAISLVRVTPIIDLHLVGSVVEKDYAETISALTQELDNTVRIHIHGYRSDYLRYLAHAKIVLQPSYAEGVSRVLRESLLLGKPIIAYDIPGTSSLITNGIDSLLVATGDIEGLSNAIESLIINASKRVSLSLCAKETYRIKASWDVFLKDLDLALSKISFRKS